MQDTSSFTRKLPGVALGLLAAVSLNLSPASGMRWSYALLQDMSLLHLMLSTVAHTDCIHSMLRRSIINAYERG